MVATAISAADILNKANLRPRPSPPHRVSDFPSSLSGFLRSQVSGAQIIGSGIDEASMSFPAVISTEEVDRVGDVLVSMGCGTEAYAGNPIVFLNHDSESIPIGVSVDESGLLYVAPEINRVLARCFCVQGGKYGQDAADIFHLIVQGAFNDVSVGFNPDPDPRFTQKLPSGGNRYEKWELLEFSVVGIGCNRGAKIIRKYLSDGRITGKHISPRLVKCLTPLAEPKPVQAVGGYEKCMEGENAGKPGVCPGSHEQGATATAEPEPEPKEVSASELLQRANGQLDLAAIGKLNREIRDLEMNRVMFGSPLTVHRLQEDIDRLKNERDRLAGVRPGETVSEWEMQQLTAPPAKPRRPRRRWGKSQSANEFAPSIGDSPQSTAGKSKRSVRKWAKPTRTKRTAMQKHIRHETDRPEGHQWVLYSHDMSKVLGTHATEEEAQKQEEAIKSNENKSMTESNGSGGGYSVPEGETKPEEPAPEKKQEDDGDEGGTDAKAAKRMSQLAYHLGRGKAYQALAKMLPKAKKDALETCVQHKIPKIAEDHPEMENDQRVAVAYSMCGEKSFSDSGYPNKDDAGGAQPFDEQTPAPIPEDTTEAPRPPSLELCQQAIENIEAALPGMEPETREFWEDILDQIRNHGKERYPGEDFGGENDAVTPTKSEDEKKTEEVLDAYRKVPESAEEKRQRVSMQKSLRELRKGDAPKVLESAAGHMHKIASFPVGRTITKSDREETQEHARALDRLHGAVTHGVKPLSDGEIGEVEGDGDEQVNDEIEKLFINLMAKSASGKAGNTASPEVENKRLAGAMDRLQSLFGVKPG